ncbi:MAG: amidohydrolase family protein [Synergistaceae bacterium]|jgi:N-acyl-D-amino-acid deacylase|nr:amidohydrolase family protein [Synergistaceae bacterium]
MPKTYDLILKNARIYDGSGGPWRDGDIAVTEGRVAGIGKISAARATRVLDVEGRAVSPGFIDPHSHADFIGVTLKDGDSKIVQGVTTDVAGQCGLTLSPVERGRTNLLRDYLKPFIPKEALPDFEWGRAGEMMDRIDRNGHATDIALLAGHGTIRIAVMGFDDRKAAGDELQRMKELLARELEDGCVGMSSGLVYPPGCFADHAELAELCEVTAAYGGIYSTHMRSESVDVLEAVKEAIAAAEESGCRLQISHHKIDRDLEGLSKETLGMMESARERGVDVTCDVYPYSSGSTLISVLLPLWAKEGGVEKMLTRLTSKEDRERIKADLKKNVPGWDNYVKSASYEKILICSASKDKTLEGKTLQAVADERGKAPDESLLDIVLSEGGEATVVMHAQSDSDNKRIMAHPLSMIGSDALAAAFTGKLAYGKAHPRSFGTFPRALGHFARDEKLFPLEIAVWKMTGFPAQRYGLGDRGLIKNGLIADFVVFDPQTIDGSADYANPRQIPKGIHQVIKNGIVVVENGRFLGQTLGKSVRRFAA